MIVTVPYDFLMQDYMKHILSIVLAAKIIVICTTSVVWNKH